MPFDNNHGYTIPELIARVKHSMEDVEKFTDEFCDTEGTMIGNPSISRIYSALNNAVEAESVCSLVLEQRELFIDPIKDAELRKTTFNFFDAAFKFSENFAVEMVRFMAYLGIPLPFDK